MIDPQTPVPKWLRLNRVVWGKVGSGVKSVYFLSILFKNLYLPVMRIRLIFRRIRIRLRIHINFFGGSGSGSTGPKIGGSSGSGSGSRTSLLIKIKTIIIQISTIYMLKRLVFGLVLWIRIRSWIRLFLADPDPDPQVQK